MTNRYFGMSINTLIIIILIISAFIIFALSDYGNYRPMSKQTKTAIGIRMVKNELERFFANHKTYPLAPASHSIAEASVTIGSQTYIMSSYITASTLDLYAPDGSQSYRYFLNGANGYILVSNGPDYDIDITAEVLPPVDSKERSTILSSLKYDPSNGVLSDGDIFQTGP